MGLGTFFEQNFKDKEVELFVNHGIEWIQYSDAQSISNMIIHAIFVSYEKDSGVMIFRTIGDNKEFYVVESFIQMFWKPGFRVMESVKTSRNTGQRLYNKKDRDIM